MEKTKLRHLIGLAIILFLLIFISVYYFFLRPSPPLPSMQADFAAYIQPHKKEITVVEGERTELRIQIKNTGRQTWRSSGQNPCLLSYHLLDNDHNTIKFDNRRFALPQKIRPQQDLDMSLTLRSPLEAGRYILEFDLLREGISWFKDSGSPTAEITLNVKAIIWPDDEMALNLQYGRFTRFHTDRKAINSLYKLIRLTLKHNEVEFAGKTGKVKGFFAGKGYPQIWLRDANTIIPASRYFYAAAYLTSWLEEHLAFQKENGALQDWINSQGNSDKNTTETDQEASAVQSAYQVFALTGPQWLQQHINQKTIISRLEAALKFVQRNRFDTDLLLLNGAHTADWGDVDLIDEGEASIYVDERTHWTVDIYDQAMFYQACLNLAEMFTALAEMEKAEYWTVQAALIKEQTNKRLWQSKKGFYTVHLHLDSLKHDFDESDIFAMGGNTLAVLSGIADEQKCQSIIETALERQKTLNLSTISGTLLPPYPAGTFAHPMMDDLYEYQNGGQWDWFGGRLIYVMYNHGYSRTATLKLEEIIRKNLHNRGFFEWDYPDGTGMGSDIFCGSAGALSLALFQGYFGLELKNNALSLEPKLGTDSAKIHAYFPVKDLFIAYDYVYNQETDSISMQFNSNTDKIGTVKILNPWSYLNTLEKLKKNLTVKLDGKNINFQITILHEDQFIVIPTDFSNHTIEISKM